jgi:hypothetical protein
MGDRSCACQERPGCGTPAATASYKTRRRMKTLYFDFVTEFLYLRCKQSRTGTIAKPRMTFGGLEKLGPSEQIRHSLRP